MKERKRQQRLLNDEQARFVRDHAEGVPVKDALALLNRTFGIDIKENQFRAWRKNHKVKGAPPGYFRKGHVPYTKGKKWQDYMTPEKHAELLRSGTTFKKGHVPHNALPVGSVVCNTQGYLVKKMAEQPRTWAFVHRLVWEEHNGPVPPGMVVRFRDGDKLNVSLDNLMLVSKQENAVVNNIIRPAPEMTETAILTARIMTAVKRRGREEIRTDH